MSAQKSFNFEGFVAPCPVLLSLANGKQLRRVSFDTKCYIFISCQFALMGEEI